MIFLGKMRKLQKNGSPFSKKKNLSSSPASWCSSTSSCAQKKDYQRVNIEQNVLDLLVELQFLHLNSPKSNKPTPLKKGRIPLKKGTFHLNQPSTFRCKLAVSFREDKWPSNPVGGGPFAADPGWIRRFLGARHKPNPRWRLGHCQDLREGGSRVVSKYSTVRL